ncbi:MAG TPA: hypothetical protein VGJ73_12760 [Verrucomicrobiae bacterium]|jgi:hypothetical protein
MKFVLCLALGLAGGFFAVNCNAAIVYPQAPDGGWQAVSNALDSKFFKPITHLPPLNDLTITRPFRVYWRSNYTNPPSESFLSATRLVGWRFLLSDGTNSAGVLLRYDDKKREWPVMGLSMYGPAPISIDPVLQTLRVAENLPQVRKEDYELRYLDFMDLQFYAFWLHGKSNDVIIPVPVYGQWQDHRSYSEGEISAILKREIEERMKQRKLFHAGPGIQVD